jgi:hypothetical protein
MAGVGTVTLSARRRYLKVGLDQNLDSPTLSDPEADGGQFRVPASEMLDAVLELRSLSVVVDRVTHTVMVSYQSDLSRSVKAQRRIEVRNDGVGGRVV